MGNLPHFMNWGAALGATAIVVPALLILYFLKLRRRETVVPSTLLWRKAIQDLQVNAPFQKLRRNLLLLLQLLILLALLLAFSRPVTSYKPPPGAVSVILIDRSASMSARDMDGKTRLEEAKRQAIDQVNSMGKEASAMVVAFDTSAETLQSFTSDQVALKNA
ncbi:MAG TPA: BatA and WFA domain-containing protein, partial [Tepidisphaeraceae bacterium]|nr:BatA and WFA domain-containing protein [Tepidisphaeraceae bacterium]